LYNKLAIEYIIKNLIVVILLKARIKLRRFKLIILTLTNKKKSNNKKNIK